MVTFVLTGRRSRPEDRVAVIRLLAVAAIGLASFRGLPWWGLVAPVTAARWLGEVRAGAPDPRVRANATIAATLILICLSPIALWASHADHGSPGSLMGQAPAGCCSVSAIRCSRS